MSGIRHSILSILKEQGQTTVAELAEALNRPSVSVRHHLDILREQGVICTDGVQRQPGRGRPRHVYVLTETARRFFPHSFEGLARELLREIKDSLPPDRVDAFFQRWVTETANTLPTGGQQSMEERLTAATHSLSEKGYLASWEEKDGGSYLLHVFNCPYDGLPAEHDELCRMDLALISRALHHTPLRVAHAIEGGHRCTYLIRTAKP